MEDPRNDIKDVVGGLVNKPTLKGQAAVLRKYFTHDVKFYQFYINTNGGLKDLISIYQMAQLFVNYQSVEFERIIYDEQENAMGLKMNVYIRPWILFCTQVCFRFFTFLELEDYRAEGGKTVKKIKVQMDYFRRVPLGQLIPLFCTLYDSDNIRFFFGGMQAFIFECLRTIFYIAVPTRLWNGILGMLGPEEASEDGMKG